MHSPLALVRDPAIDALEGPRAAEPFDALEHLVGVNLARLRAERQLSLDALAPEEIAFLEQDLKAHEAHPVIAPA